MDTEGFFSLVGSQADVARTFDVVSPINEPIKGRRESRDDSL
jgi:hypothetical protein